MILGQLVYTFIPAPQLHNAFDKQKCGKIYCFFCLWLYNILCIVCVCFCVCLSVYMCVGLFVPEHAESEFDTGHRLLSLSTYILTQVLEIQYQLPMLV